MLIYYASFLSHPSDNRFFDSVEIFNPINEKLYTFQKVSHFSSLALHGLGSVGKSDIALQYGHSRNDAYDMILWIHNETLNSLKQRFTEIIRAELRSFDVKKYEINKALLMK